jgi:hypothetical protein
MKNSTLKVDNQTYKTALIPPPLATENTSMVRMKNEFVFAKQAVMETSEQRLLFNAIARFDTSVFKGDDKVIRDIWDSNLGHFGGPNYAKITQEICDNYFCTMEKRTILLPVAEVLKFSGTRNHERLDEAVNKLRKRDITIVRKVIGGKEITDHINLIERIRKIKIDGSPAEVLITFTQSFMPYVIALSGYRAMELRMLAKLRQKYSLRYYHWFTYHLGNKKEGQFAISVKELRERFELSNDEHKRGLVERLVKKPLEEINKHSDLEITFLRNMVNTSKGKELKSIVFNIKSKDAEVEE